MRVAAIEFATVSECSPMNWVSKIKTITNYYTMYDMLGEHLMYSPSIQIT